MLKRMQRFYSITEFDQVVSAFRKAMPNMTIATDVICGFPGETTEAFENTVRLIEKVKPDVINVSKFFPRPNTPAAKLEPRIPSNEIKRRSKRMSDLVKQVTTKKNETWINWNGQILIDERGRSLGSWIGRNFAYKPIVVKSSESLMGRTVKVHVTKAHQTYLEAEIVADPKIS